MTTSPANVPTIAIPPGLAVSYQSDDVTVLINPPDSDDGLVYSNDGVHQNFLWSFLYDSITPTSGAIVAEQPGVYSVASTGTFVLSSSTDPSVPPISLAIDSLDPIVVLGLLPPNPNNDGLALTFSDPAVTTADVTWQAGGSQPFAAALPLLNHLG
jgi:hypothetical protein